MSSEQKTTLIDDGMTINPIRFYDWLNRQIILRRPTMDDYDAGFTDCLIAIKEQVEEEMKNSPRYNENNDKKR
jgi:hypothetical protein